MPTPRRPEYKQNLVFSVVLLAILIPSAVVGFLTVVAAVLAHEISELLAVANGVRAARTRPAPVLAPAPAGAPLASGVGVQEQSR